MNKDKQVKNNCRCCGDGYIKSTDESKFDDVGFSLPYLDENGHKKTPVGFCCFCDRKNEIYYDKNYKCHAV